MLISGAQRCPLPVGGLFHPSPPSHPSLFLGLIGMAETGSIRTQFGDQNLGGKMTEPSKWKMAVGYGFLAQSGPDLSLGGRGRDKVEGIDAG